MGEVMRDAVAAEDLPEDGLCLSYIIDEFIPNNGGPDRFEGMTTAEVCEEIIKDATREANCSYCAMRKSEMHPAFLRRPTTFVSHAHSYKFLDVINALKYFLVHNNEEEVILWFDLFSINQNGTTVWPFDWLASTFRKTIGDFGRVVMVMSPWNSPIPFTRAWCVYEAYCCAITPKSKFDIALSEKDQKKFLDDIKGDVQNAICEMISSISSDTSECSVKEDKENIHAIIAKDVGFSELDAMLFERYRAWVISTARTALDHCSDENTRLEIQQLLGSLHLAQGSVEKGKHYIELVVTRRNSEELPGRRSLKCLNALHELGKLRLWEGEHREACSIFNECVNGKTKLLGKSHPSSIGAMLKLAYTYLLQGDYGKAGKLYEEAYELRKVKLGEDHHDTITALSWLSDFYQSKGDYLKGHEGFWKCFQRRAFLLGVRHPDTLTSMNFYGVSLRRMGQYRAAVDHLLHCSSIQQTQLGIGHEYVWDTKQNLANVYCDMGLFDEAAELSTLCLEKVGKLHGKHHVWTLSMMDSLGRIKVCQGAHSEARGLLTECLEARKKKLGEKHPQTLATMHNLACLQVAEGEYPSAERLLRQCYQDRQSCLGEKHPSTLETVYSLASLLASQDGKKDEAAELFSSCLRSRTEVLGDSHPKTIDTKNCAAACNCVKGDSWLVLDIVSQPTMTK